MYSVSIDKSAIKVEKSGDSIIVNEEILIWDFKKTSEKFYHIIQEGKSFNLEVVSVNSEEKTVTLKLNNKPATVKMQDKFDLLLEKLGMNTLKGNLAKEIKAPMPGLIFDIKVSEGDVVKKGDPVLILEAMKMENIIKSPGDGTVKTIKIKKGDSVEKNQVLIQF
ncbi:acetyl/propionyl-CoA carboxylase, alpha subunit [Belliella baltica DSM 15883]|uniref:Acetyl/propionyl-CoA carboxylase, alpha subunit n=1 Tax=Belliella baltica (strain DSM 15883 / CIP 108006 / LMG 21964 / BA134) TaxID=866536 RepID=I3Z4X7_BELBD|nr:acetyl-CoA carboxylase biotin carboxyl carrier protein subunit [Belliella baltica]AFL84295.1 acetyl/propionyl-CoA carboxylase, alpha subunit [Belliella baltica DSM 15883]